MGRYPKGSGEKGKKSEQKKSSNESKEEKQKKGSQSQKKELNNSENSGITYAGRKISSYIANPKTLGDEIKVVTIITTYHGGAFAK